MRNIRNRFELKALAEKLGVRPDWHEPDEQELTITFGGESFDNAMMDERECHIVLKKDGISVARVNIAYLLAWATGYEA